MDRRQERGVLLRKGLFIEYRVYLMHAGEEFVENVHDQFALDYQTMLNNRFEPAAPGDYGFPGHPEDVPDTNDEVQALLLARIKAADRLGSLKVLNRWAHKYGIDRLLTEILEPTLQTIGEEWCSKQSYTLAQAYVAAKVAEDALTEIAAAAHNCASLSPANRAKGNVVIGNVEEDFHALGRRMVGTFLRAEGWQVRDLGNDVTPVDFVDTAIEIGARVVGVSAMTLSTARNIQRVRAEINRRGLKDKVKLAVGGAVFNATPGLVKDLGGDGTAPSALGAGKLFDRLWRESEVAEMAA